MDAALAPVFDPAQLSDDDILAWMAAGLPRAKTMRAMPSFRRFVEYVGDETEAESELQLLTSRLGALREEQDCLEWATICEVRIGGGSGEGADRSLATATAAKRKALTNGISCLLRRNADRQRQFLLLKFIAACLTANMAFKRHSQHPPHWNRTIVFERRPFGMTPLKQDDALGYVVQSVNHNDPTKPAARLGVKVGWSVVRVNETEVCGLSCDDVQAMLKVVELPVHVEFDVRSKGASGYVTAEAQSHEPQVQASKPSDFNEPLNAPFLGNEAALPHELPTAEISVEKSDLLGDDWIVIDGAAIRAELSRESALGETEQPDKGTLQDDQSMVVTQESSAWDDPEW